MAEDPPAPSREEDRSPAGAPVEQRALDRRWRLMAVAYGYPIAQFFIDPPPEAVIHRLS